MYMKKKFTQFRWLLTTLMLVAAMLMSSVASAVSLIKPSGEGSSSNPYQISTAAHLYWFAGLVNGTLTDGTAKNTAACAKLTANITVNSGVLKSDGTINSDNVSDFTAWTPIGYFNSSSDYACYNGTFDGNGKTISGLYLSNNTLSYMGLFGYSSGTIKNVGVVDSYFKGYVYIGGVCGLNSGKVELCYSKSYLYGSNIGGVCGLNFPGAVITNCYSTGIIKGGENVGGVCGANTNASITNCHNVGSLSGSTSVGSVCGNNTGTISKCYYDNVKCKIKGINGSDVSDQAEGKSTTQFQRGEVAYLLQGSQSEIVWGQTIGTDSYPVIGGKEVFYGYIDCQNGMTYSNNTETSDTPLHSYNNGFCTVCNAYQPAEQVSDTHYPELCYEYKGYYAIENAGQLYWFADQVNNHRNLINVVLTANITVNSGVIDSNGSLASNTSSFRQWTPIGWWTETGSVKYNGIIDGNNHYISGLYFNDENANSVGLLGYTVGTVRNLGIIGSYFKGGNNVGSMYGYGSGRIINCFFYHGQVHGTQYVGGMCGNSYGTSTLMCNSYMTGTVSGTKNVGSMCGYSAQENTIANCYYDKEKCSIGGINGSDVAGQAEGKTLAEFKSGKITYLLSQGCTVDGEKYSGIVWGQTLGLIDYPYFRSICKKVYAGYDKCDENAEKIYSNTELPTTTLPHSCDGNGFCTVCTTGYQPAELVSNTNHADLLETHNGYYAIENAGQLYWLAKQVNSGNTGVKAVVTNNITINNGNVLSVGNWRDWTPIGNESNAYSGKFDGQEYTLRGLYLVETEESNLGLFGYIGNDGGVSNLNVENLSLKGYENVGVICGYLSQGTITNCNVYNGEILCAYQSAGGICGYVRSGTISNCSNRCSLDAQDYSVGGICGYNKGTIDNCRNSADINIGKLLYVGGVCGYNEGLIKNSLNNSNRVASSGKCVGGVCGLNTKTISNCHNNASVSADQGYVGGVCGKSLDGKISDCYNDGEVYIMKLEDSSNEYDYIGGICGYAENTNFINCYNLRGITTPWDYAGGICGYMNDTGFIRDSYNKGNISASYYVGGVCGYGGVLGDITNCYNTGSITGSGSYVGGIAGKINNSIVFNGCYNTGSISGGLDYVGGISGFSLADTKNCYNKGDVKGSKNNIGGLLGNNTGNVFNCFNTGRVEGESKVGGLVGTNAPNWGKYIFNCFKTGEVIGTGDDIGELCGKNNSFGTITRCFIQTGQNVGNVVGNLEGTFTNILTLSIDAFKSGEVAYMLSQGSMVIDNKTYDGSVWGQQLGTDNYPVFGDYKVIKAAKGDNDTYWATFSNRNSNAELMASTGEITVYNATVSGGTLTLTKRSDNKVALGEGVLLKANCEYVNAMNISDEVSAAATGENNLVATPATEQTINAETGYTLYRLTYNNVSEKTGLGFYLGLVKDENGKVDETSLGKKLKATPGKAYLKVSPGAAAPARGFVFPGDDETTGIGEIVIEGDAGISGTANANDRIYNLQGQQISTPVKGIYIKNNKKVIIK